MLKISIVLERFLWEWIINKIFPILKTLKSYKYENDPAQNYLPAIEK